ncbi:MAG TPA: lytic transglycosylase domain-containing protein [Crenalkalicoccus sp.]|nr:lytic transglycosylase domain-containing protein [Crenalkalicoccus sp.]
MARALAFLLLLLPALARADPVPDAELCRQAIAAAEPGSGIPPGLLGAIALVESGRADPRTGRIAPWPWAWNAGGEGHLPADRATALAEVSSLLARGSNSVDVGCMQVNLAWHPQAFPSLETAFDPAANVRYAIAFLRELRARTGDWAQAVAQYHSAEVERGLDYQRRVVLARLGAAFVHGGAVPLPVRLTAGLCAPGMAPVMRFPPPKARGVARPHLGCRRR